MIGKLPLTMLLLVNGVVFLFGCLITGLSYLAYRDAASPRSFRWSTLGFALITVGSTVEPVYQFGIRRDFDIGAAEILRLQALEGVFIALGLILLFASVYGYGTSVLDERSAFDGSETVEKDTGAGRGLGDPADERGRAESER